MIVLESSILLIFAFMGWALCGAIMGIGMKMTSMKKALIIHAVGAPIIFIILSSIYFSCFFYTSPLLTAIVFVSFVVVVDFFIVALLINKSIDMFKSVLGTWLPFTLIFISTYLTGIIIT